MPFSGNLQFRLTGLTGSSPGFYRGFRLVSVSKKNYFSGVFGNLGIPLPMLILAHGPASIIISLAAGGIGIGGIAFIKDPGFLIIPTDLISTPVDSIRRRIPDQPDLVSLDLEPVSRSKITMPEIGYECSLPDQIMHNPKCSLRPSEIADIAANADVGVPLSYDEVVNMQDVTKLTTVEFNDRFEISPGPKPTTNFQLRRTKRFHNQGKTANFLEKFGDPEFISDMEQWEITTPTPQDAIRIQDREL